MRRRLLISAVAALIFLTSEAASQINANPTIPRHLLPCYRNPDIYLRVNRLPSKLRIFTDLIRKVENSPSGRQMSARSLSMALLYYLRLDGIQATPNVKQTPDVTPFAAGGNNYFKHRLTLIGLLPKPNRPTNYAFFNESLTEFEMCNLHFMLSYSTDFYKREDEDCSAIKFEGSGGYDQSFNRDYYYDYDRRYNSYMRSQSLRHKRQVRPRPGSAPHVDKLEERWQRLRENIRSLRRNVRNVEKGERRRRRRVAWLGRSHGDGEENLKHPDVEEIPTNVLQTLPNLRNSRAKINGASQKFTLGFQDMLGPGEDHILRGGYAKRKPTRTGEGSLYKRTAAHYGESPKIMIPNLELSDCPLENGVVKARFGSVTIGTVIAGIAAGFNHQMLSLSELNAESKGPLAGERINNIWATTLTGNAADLILSLGLIRNVQDGVGLKGGWNDTARPKWYLLGKNTPDHLTDVELRGALDGLWIGSTIRKTGRAMEMMRLSDIINFYYSDRGLFLDGKVKAARRTDEVTEYAPTNEFIKQLHLLSVVMENQRISPVTYVNFTNIVSETVRTINNYIPELSPSSKVESASNPINYNIMTEVNLVVVFDPAYGEENIHYYVADLMEKDWIIMPGQRTLTLICPYITNKSFVVRCLADFEFRFNEIFQLCQKSGRAINYHTIYEQVINEFSGILQNENELRRMNVGSQISLFFLTDSQETPDEETAQRDVSRAQEYVPDMNVIVITNGAKEKFKHLVQSPEKDILSLKVIKDDPVYSVDEVLERIVSVPRRLSNPACGTMLRNSTFYEGDALAIDEIQKGSTAFYKLSSQYFYNSKDVKLQVRSKEGQHMVVCHARDDMKFQPILRRLQKNYNMQDSYPPDFFGDNDEPHSSEGECKTSADIVFDFSDLCEDAESFRDCKPLFLFVHVPKLYDLKSNCANCNYAINVEYDIKISNLTCSGSRAIITSLLLILLNSIVTLLAHRLF